MQLRVIRLIIATFGAKLSKCDGTYKESTTTIKPYGQSLRPGPNNSTFTILDASQCVDSLPVEGQVIHIPERLRRELERALEEYINILAVLHRCSRSLSSPYPCIAIE